MADASAYLSFDGAGNATLNTDALTSDASSQAVASLASAQSNDPALNAALTASVGALTTATTLLAGSAAAGPVGLAASVLFGAGFALVAADPAKSGAGGLYDASGVWLQAPASASDPAGWRAWLQSVRGRLALTSFGVSSSYYDVPNPAAGSQNGAPTIGAGPRPGWASGSFQDFADKLLVADYTANMTFDNVIAGKSYNFARWPALLALAIKSWNSTHAAGGSPQTISGIFGLPAIVVPNTGGTQSLSVTATAPASFGGQAQPGLVPSATDSISVALWLAQFTLADWAAGAAGITGTYLRAGGDWTNSSDYQPTPVKVPLGGAIRALVNNGPAINRGEWTNIPAGASLIPPGWTAATPAATAALGPGDVNFATLHATPVRLDVGAKPPAHAAVGAAPAPSWVGLATIIAAGGAMAIGMPVAAAGVITLGAVAGFIEAIREL